MSSFYPTAITPADQAAHDPDAVARLANILWQVIADRDNCTFVELKRAAEDARFPATGTRSLILESDPNVTLWIELSDVLLGAIENLLREQRIYMEPCSWWTYFADGTLLTLPTVKRPPRGGYRRRHWLPIVFRTVPF